MSKKVLRIVGWLMLVVMVSVAAIGPLSSCFAARKDVTPLEFDVETKTSMGYEDSYYSFTVENPGTLKITKGSNSGKDPIVTFYDSIENLEADRPLKGPTESVKITTELPKAGTYYISVCSKCSFVAKYEQDYANQSIAGAKKVTVGMNKTVEITQDRTDGTHQYYYLSPDDKSYYEFELTTFGAVTFFDAKGNRYLDTTSVADVNSFEKKTISVPAGTKKVVFSLYGLESKGAATVKITRTDFIDIKKISFSSSSYSITGSKVITLKADLGKDAKGKAIKKAFESTLTYSMKDSKGKKVAFFTVDKKNKLKVKVGNDYNAGVYTLTVKTSEGLKASATVKIGLTKMDLKNRTTSEGNVNSSTVNWTKKPLADLYYLYLLKGDKYTKVGQTSKTSYTFKKLKENKTYSFKIAPVTKDKVDGKTVYIVGAQSQTWKFITAKSTKPKLKSVSCKGCKYFPGEWVPGRYDAGGVWHAGYTGNSYSVATFKASFDTIKGAKSYYASNGSINPMSGGTFSITYSGKKSSVSTAKIKIRACYALSDYNSYAYGPWSNEKTVKVPAAK